jgi:DsbC/DsbD-like thiol-disulfide interchange protein
MVAMVPFHALIACVAFVGINAAATMAHAQDASPWARDSHSALRLVAGSRAGSVLMGGIEIQLEKGWKTYWRTPGDSGVPPRFDFSKSSNVESVTPLYPAPRSFNDGAGGISFGYVKNVVFPLRIVPKNPNEPVKIAAAISYAVCEKLCLPVEAEVELAFTSTASAQDSLVAVALNKVPKPATTTDTTPYTLRSFVRQGDKVMIDITAQNPDAIELFAEGPSPDWALPLPKQVTAADKDAVRFAFPLEGLPADARAEGALLKLTVVGPDGAYEYNVRLN